MKSLKKNNNKLRLDFKKKEKNFLISKIIFTFLALKKKKKLLHTLKKTKFFLKYFSPKRSKISIINRCNITNRSRNNIQNFGASRFILRNFMGFGIIPGYKKAVW